MESELPAAMSPDRVENATLQRLAPHLVARPRRGVVGSSRQARQLREAIRTAAADRERHAVLVFGEPGLEKDNLAALIHFGSVDRHRLMLRIDGSRMRSDGADLFGAASQSEDPPLLQLLADGSLLVDNLDQVPEPARQALLNLARTGAWRSVGSTDPPHRFQGRLFFTAETSQTPFDGCCSVIRVPPLRVRRQDLGEWLRYGVRQRSRRLGWEPAPEVPMAVVKQLQTHEFPNNLRELDALIDRAIQQVRHQENHQINTLTRRAPKQLPEDVFWTSPRQEHARFDLWRWKPQLRDWMRSPRLWNGLLFGLVSWVFVLVNLWLWQGPQDRAHNGALNLFWAWWWPLILIGFPLVGRLWCSFCPFMVWGTITQRLAQRLGWQPLAWPRGDHDRWASRWLSAGFALILIWESVWDLPNTAWLSSCLLLLITAGAVIGSLRFEKRFWCRYLCPIGGMNGLFAKLSILELRAQAGICSGNCSSYACFKGGPAEGEGLATDGCPLGTHPAHLRDNRNCVLCLSCAQACPHRSVRLAIRPPAADLQREMVTPAGEPALLLILMGSVALGHWQRLWSWSGLAPASLSEGPLLPRLAVASATLALPALLYGLARPFVSRIRLERCLYGLLPLVWALLLSHHLPLGMTEAGLLLPVSLSPWLGGVALPLPHWQAQPAVIGFCQSGVVALGTIWSLVILRRMFRHRRGAWIGASCLMLTLAICGRSLVNGSG